LGEVRAGPRAVTISWRVVADERSAVTSVPSAAERSSGVVSSDVNVSTASLTLMGSGLKQRDRRGD